jgi:hypothetical protein
MKHTCISAFLALVLCLAFSAVWAQGDFPLTYQAFKDDSDPLARVGKQYVPRVQSKPAEITDVPSALKDKGAYFAAGDLILAVELSDPPKLYADTNCDHSFADEKPLTASGKKGPFLDFGVVTIKDPHAQDGSVRTFSVQAYAQGNTVHYLYVGPAGYRSGEIKVGDKTYAVAVVDKNLNGRFDDTLPNGGYDLLALDSDHNGAFDLGGQEVMPLGKMIRLNGAYLTLKVKADGSAVSVEEADGTLELGTLDVGSPQVWLSVTSDLGAFRLNASDGTWQLPVGTYQIAGLGLAAKDKEGADWTMQCLRPPQDKRQFEIRKGETTSITLGPSLVVASDVTPERGGVSVGVTVTGRSGELYLAGAVKAGTQQGPPTVKILDEKGTVLASGAVTYG